MKKMSMNKVLLNFFLFLSIIVALQIPYIHNIYPNSLKYLNVISFISFFFLLILLKSISLKNFSFYLIGYYLILILSTLKNHNSVNGILTEMFTFLMPIFFINSFSKEKFDDSVGTILFAFELLAYINFLTVILYPNGLYNVGLDRKYFFLGHVNIAIRYLLPGSCLSLAYSFSRKGKIMFRTWLFIVCSILTLLITFPATAIVGYVIFLGMTSFIIKFSDMRKVFNPFNSYLLGLIITYMIVVVGIQYKFQSFITNTLHRDLTFTGRTLIWENAIKNINNKFIMGYGRMADETRRLYLRGATSAHNQYLNLLFESGVVSLAYIFFLFYILKNKIKLCTNHKIVAIFLATMISYAIMWIFEPFSYSGTFAMFLIFAIMYKSNVYYNS